MSYAYSFYSLPKFRYYSTSRQDFIGYVRAFVRSLLWLQSRGSDRKDVFRGKQQVARLFYGAERLLFDTMSLSCSYYPDYFSINDILATEERITCCVEILLPRLGFLDPASDAQDLKPGTKLELPFWLAHSLNARRRPIVSVEIPKFYKDGYREILEADACAVTLSKWNPHYYELGMCLRQFNNRECEKITDSLLQTFKNRFRLVMDWAQNPVSDPTLGAQLPTLERGLFLDGRKARALLIEWLKSGGGIIETSEVVANLMKKRKRMDF